MPRSFLCYFSTIIVHELCSNTAVNVTSYFLLFALQGNTTTNGGANNSLCANNIQIPRGGSKTYSCRPKAYGRYLYIRIPGRNKILTLCEVEVYSLSKSFNLSSCLFSRYAWCLCVYLFSPFTKQVIWIKKYLPWPSFILHCRHTTCIYSCTCTLDITKLIQKWIQYSILRCLKLRSKKTSKGPSAL